MQHEVDWARLPTWYGQLKNSLVRGAALRPLFIKRPPNATVVRNLSKTSGTAKLITAGLSRGDECSILFIPWRCSALTPKSTVASGRAEVGLWTSRRHARAPTYLAVSDAIAQWDVRL
jgi:hypothetical protein